MPQFPSLPDPAHLTDLLALFPGHVQSLMTYTNQVMRGPGALPVAERELIAAYVSGLNACQFCFKSHRIYAAAFGIDDAMIDALIEDFEGADIGPERRALLAYAGKLAHLPARLVAADAQAVLQAGYSEKALFEVIEITGLFSLYNRLIEGAGVNFDYDTAAADQKPGQSDDKSQDYLRYAGRVLDTARQRGTA